MGRSTTTCSPLSSAIGSSSLDRSRLHAFLVGTHTHTLLTQTLLSRLMASCLPELSVRDVTIECETACLGGSIHLDRLELRLDDLLRQLVDRPLRKLIDLYIRRRAVQCQMRR